MGAYYPQEIPSYAGFSDIKQAKKFFLLYQLRKLLRQLTSVIAH